MLALLIIFGVYALVCVVELVFVVVIVATALWGTRAGPQPELPRMWIRRAS